MHPDYWDDFSSSPDQKTQLRRINSRIFSIEAEIRNIESNLYGGKPTGGYWDDDSVATPKGTAADRQDWERRGRQGSQEARKLLNEIEELKDEKSWLKELSGRLGKAAHERWLETPEGRRAQQLEAERIQKKAERRAALHPITRFLEDTASWVPLIVVFALMLGGCFLVIKICSDPYLVLRILGMCPTWCGGS